MKFLLDGIGEATITTKGFFSKESHHIPEIPKADRVLNILYGFSLRIVC
jgi:hypothetical protein